MKYITVRLTKTGNSRGPFSILDAKDNILLEDISKDSIVYGLQVGVPNDTKIVKIQSENSCIPPLVIPVLNYDANTIEKPVQPNNNNKQCVWEHYADKLLFNNFYGNIAQYIIEHPFSYQYQDQILQSIKDYTKCYKSLFTGTDMQKIENDAYFNKSVIYNGHQCTGLLKLERKPSGDLRKYASYPIFNKNSKTILYSKSDNFYQYNTFWSIIIDPSLPMFKRSNKSMSIDKEINDANMDYGKRSHKKDTIRAKELKIRSILDNRSDIQLVSQFIVTPTQISHK